MFTADHYCQDSFRNNTHFGYSMQDVPVKIMQLRTYIQENMLLVIHDMYVLEVDNFFF